MVHNIINKVNFRGNEFFFFKKLQMISDHRDHTVKTLNKRYY